MQPSAQDSASSELASAPHWLADPAWEPSLEPGGGLAAAAAPLRGGEEDHRWGWQL